MISGLAERGHRVVALDLMGHGRSDKPAARSDYTLASHVDWMQQWLVAEDLTDVTLYCQDWGGLAGLHLLRLEPDRFARVIASNTGVPTGEGVNKFMEWWLDFSQKADSLPIANLIGGSCTRQLSEPELAAYEAPYPDGSYQMSPLQFPLLIPIQPDNPGVPMCVELWAYLETWEKPFATIYGSEDPVSYKPGAHEKFKRKVPGAQGQPHVVVDGAHHFIQEDASPELVDFIDTFVRKT
jgi:haloalkane dehalogenase